MLRKNNRLEFEIFQDFPQISHGISLRNHEIEKNHLASCIQTHGTTTHLVDEKWTPQEGDALCTKKGGVQIRHADCQAALFYDPINQAIAAAHAGWRGNVQNIYAEVIRRMQEWFGSRPENLLVGISPSLGPKHAEFIHFREEFPQHFWDFECSPNHFNLWEIGRMQLREAGVLNDHIEIAEICTFEGDFHSYRRDKTKLRHRSFIAFDDVIL